MSALRNFWMVLLMIFTMEVSAAKVQSVADGDWSSPATWSSGSVPLSTDEVDVKHRVNHGASLRVATGGKVMVEVGARLNVVNDLDNAGVVVAHDSLVLGGIENSGTIENHAVLLQKGNIENRPTGTILNFGTILLTGDLMNYGTFYSTGTVHMKGDLENWGLTVSPSGSHSYFDVCGSAKHHSGATVSGTNYLCVKCGGSYDQEPGRVGDFILECHPLDVVIGEFTAAVTEQGKVQLHWVTMGESNSDWFVIERGTIIGGNKTCKVGKCGKTGEFKEIGRVKAAGSSTQPLNYAFLDERPIPGLNYYRLRMVDNNGFDSYSAVVDAWVEPKDVTLLAYPNPNNSILHVQVAGILGVPGKLSLYSVDGRLVWERSLDLGPIPRRIDIAVCDFAAGVYLLKLQQGSREEVRKLIFQK